MAAGPSGPPARRERDRAVGRALADIAARERRLAGHMAARPASESVPGTVRVQRSAAPALPSQHPGMPWTLPREIVDALSDLEARERSFAERVAAERRGGSPSPGEPEGRETRAPPKLRRHPRIRPRNTRTTIVTADGRRLNASVINVSQSGVAIEGNLPGLWIGSMVTVGSRRAKAARALLRGMAFEFSIPVPPEMLDIDFVL